MAGKKGAGENSKRAAGMAKKAEVAAQKAAAEAAKLATAEEKKWQAGAKSNAKKEAEAAKKAEQAQKKAERDALLAEEEASTPARSTPKKSKTAVKKTRGLDLSALDDDAGKSSGSRTLTTLNASGIDNALDALSLTTGPSVTKVDKHPERRYPAAYAKFEERRLVEMEADGTGDGLRLNQKKERIKKEFEKSPENPFNQLTVKYNASKGEIDEIKLKEQDKIEKRLGFP